MTTFCIGDPFIVNDKVATHIVHITKGGQYRLFGFDGLWQVYHLSSNKLMQRKMYSRMGDPRIAVYQPEGKNVPVPE